MFTTLLLLLSAASVSLDTLPEAGHGLAYTEPATVWDEAMPLGNGTLGALVWGDGAPLKISLDRTDLWDLRPVPEYHSEEYSYALMQQWEAEGKYEDLLRVYDNPYHRPAPTKIPAGRIELSFPEGVRFSRASLDVRHATAQVDLEFDEAKTETRVWIHATEPLGFIQLSSVPPVRFELKLIAPAFGGKEESEVKPAIVAGELSELGYPPPAETSGVNWQASEQEGWGGFRFAQFVMWLEAPAPGVPWTAVWSVASTFEGENPLEIARARVETALKGMNQPPAEPPALRVSHEAWWNGFWAKSRVQVPNKIIERQWYLDTYKFGAASRRGAPPITLQGPWTADNGRLPPWKGDYHHDLNTQLSYWPCYSGNRLEDGLAFLDWLWDTREHCVAWTQRFFGLPGMNVPMTADLNNNQIGGWRQYTHSATTGAWLSHHFYLHWKFSADDTFLRERGYPYLRETAIFLEAVTQERDAEGKRSLPLSSSPEIHDNKPEAWFSTMTNYDNALIRFVFGASAEMAAALDKTEDAARWQQALGEMPPLAIGEDGTLLVAAGHPLHESHRHFSHLMAIHPLGLIDLANGEEDARIIHASLRQLEALGTNFWVGYSYSWLGNLAARAKDGKKAEQALEIFASAFVLRNSFHCNGDQSGKGYSDWSYRPFTLEGNFASAAGLQEMLLQSHTGIIEIFPAIPDSWQEAAFERLRAQGGFLVSSALEAGRVTVVTLQATRDATCSIRLPWSGEVEEITLRAGYQRVLRPPAQQEGEV